MTSINSSLIPTKSPGTLFDNLTGLDKTLDIRWLISTDPVFYETTNRPMADIAVRQLVIAKAVDNLQLKLGHQTLFPFIVQPKVASGTTQLDIPLQWIWDFHASLPKKWENLRLAKIKRIAGDNSTTNGYDGVLRLIFTANVTNFVSEIAVFYADYVIDSQLTYQLVGLNAVDSEEEAAAIPNGESETVSGNMVFKTLDTELNTVQTFLNLLEPPANTTDGDGDGYYDNPTVYEIVDTVAGGATEPDDFSLAALSHGTGLLTDSAWNTIPELNSDAQSWIRSFNYPFDLDSNRKSTDNITIPVGMFREFNIAVPAGDSPTGDVSGTYYPVWINRIERLGTSSDQLRFFFATYNITDIETGGSPSTEPVEFAVLDLISSYNEGEVVEIIPIDNLLLKIGTDAQDWDQGFGRGHVVLSSLWGGTTTAVQDFFDSFSSIVETPADTSFSIQSTRISSFGLSRIPKYIPTVGQSQALLGSTSRLTNPINPNIDNRYVTEKDQGLGRTIDLEAQPGIVANSAIDRYGYTGALTHKIIKLAISSKDLGSDPSFYQNQVLPRLIILLGREPQFGDFLYNGQRLMFFNGDTWVG